MYLMVISIAIPPFAYNDTIFVSFVKYFFYFSPPAQYLYAPAIPKDISFFFAGDTLPHSANATSAAFFPE